MKKQIFFVLGVVLVSGHVFAQGLACDGGATAATKATTKTKEIATEVETVSKPAEAAANTASGALTAVTGNDRTSAMNEIAMDTSALVNCKKAIEVPLGSCWAKDYVTSARAVSLALCTAEGQLYKGANLDLNDTKSKKNSGFMGVKSASIGKNAYQTSRDAVNIGWRSCSSQLGGDGSNALGVGETSEFHGSAGTAKCSSLCNAGAEARPVYADATVSTAIGPHRAAHAQAMNQLQVICRNEVNTVKAEFLASMQAAEAFRAGAVKTRNAWMAGAIGTAAVVGGVAIYDDYRDDKKEKKAREASQREYAQGIVTLGSGEKLNCLSSSTYTRSECRDVLFSYCAKDENSSKAGCSAFANNYCSAADGSKSYCLARSAKTYCAQSGSVVGESPACGWMASRDSSCGTNPGNLNCMVSFSATELATKCTSFPNDPVCQSYAAGTLITQSGSAWSAATPATSTNSLNSVVGTGTGTTTLSSTTNNVVTAQSLLGANSSAYQNLCATGQLVNCN